jgi:hypothetical protein
MSIATKTLHQARASAETVRDRAAAGYAEAHRRAGAAAKALAGEQPSRTPVAAAVAGGLLVGALAATVVRGIARYLTPASRRQEETPTVPVEARADELVHHH